MAFEKQRYSVQQALRGCLVAYLERMPGQPIPTRQVDQVTRDGTNVTATSVGEQPAWESLLKRFPADSAVPTAIASLSDAIVAALADDASHVDHLVAADLLLLRHLREHGPSVDAVALAESDEAFQAFASHEEIAVRLVAPLDNFESAEGTVRLGDDVVLHRISEEERHTIWNDRGDTLMRMHVGALAAIGTWTHTVHVEHRVERFGDATSAGALQDRISNIETALRLQHEGSVQAARKWFEFLPPIGEFGPALRPRPMFGTLSSPTIPARSSYRLDEADATQVPELLTGLEARKPDDRTFELALRRFNGAYSRGPLEDRMIDLWVALEALFAPEFSTELRFRVSSRIARFVGRDKDERVDIMEFLRLSYDVRSHLVHGGAPDRFKKELQKKVDGAKGLEPITDRTEDLLRQALRGFLSTPRSSAQVVKAIDDEMMG